jgi:hypothetical protein
MGRRMNQARVLQGVVPGRSPQCCIGCRAPIVYGDRCNDCQRRLRHRKRRKLHR